MVLTLIPILWLSYWVGFVIVDGMRDEDGNR